MVRDRLLHAEPASCADIIDEYRELAMLAHAWEHGSIALRVAEEAPGSVAESPADSAAIGEGHGHHL